MFRFINLLHICVIRPQQSNSWGSQTEEENQKKKRLVRHRITFAHPTPNLLTCVGSFTRTEWDPSCSGIRQLARGNSHKLQPGKCQLDRSKVSNKNNWTLQPVAQRGCSDFSPTDLENSPGRCSEEGHTGWPCSEQEVGAGNFWGPFWQKSVYKPKNHLSMVWRLNAPRFEPVTKGPKNS